MRPSWSFLTYSLVALLLCIQFVCAVPVSDDHDAPTSTSNSPSTPAATSLASTAPRVHSTVASPINRTRSPDVDGTDTPATSASRQSPNTANSSQSLVIPPIPTPHHTWSHTGPITLTLTHHFPTPTPPAATPPSAPSSHGQSAVAIVFEVIAGVVVTMTLLALGRFYWSYRRTPPRDRIGAFLNRHHLEREMEEAERARMERLSRALEERRWRPPPPPYQNAPSYEEVVATESIDWGRPSPLPTSHSPPPRPT